MPLLLLPFVIGLSSDAWISLGRVGAFLTAEELPPPYPVDPSSKFAIDCDGDFTWEVSDPALATGSAPGKGKGGPGGAKGKGKGADKGAKKDKKEDKKKAKQKPTNGEPSNDASGSGTATATGTVDESGEEDHVFQLNDLKIKVPKGHFVALVGRIGSGKSSCLNALIGEMRKTRGSVGTPNLLNILVCLPGYRLFAGHIWRRCCLCPTKRLVGQCHCARQYSFR